MKDDRFAGISDADVWAEWVRRRAAIRLKVAKEYHRHYKRKVRAGVPRGERGAHLMKKYREASALDRIKNLETSLTRTTGAD